MQSIAQNLSILSAIFNANISEEQLEKLIEKEDEWGKAVYREAHSVSSNKPEVRIVKPGEANRYPVCEFRKRGEKE